MENKKYVLGYFGHSAVCSSPQQAIDFINALPYHGNGNYHLSCNDACKNFINKIFAEGVFPDGCEVTTTGCGTTRIHVYPAMADTLEEHYTILGRKKQAEIEKWHKTRWDELVLHREGTYYITMSYSQKSLSEGMVNRLCCVEAKLSAQSGYDAYNKLTQHIESNPRTDDSVPVVNCFPEPFSNYFSSEYVTQTDDYCPITILSME